MSALRWLQNWVHAFAGVSFSWNLQIPVTLSGMESPVAIARSGSCRCAIYVGLGVFGLRRTRALLESGVGELACLVSSPCAGAGERNGNNG